VSELSESVASLTEPRHISTTQEIDGVQHFRVVKHPSLLELLISGTGSASGHGSSEPGVPIDADALELWAQIRDFAADWCRDARVPFRRDELAGSLKTWAARFEALNVADEVYHDRVRQVDSWGTWIEAKFNPDVKLEWTKPCPNPDCGVRRIATLTPLGVVEQFAIEVNVTKRAAECRSCGARWYGEQGLKELAFLSNIAGRSDLEPEVLALLMSRDTPISHT